MTNKDKRTQKDTDYLDNLFDKLYDQNFMNSSIADFGQKVRETINEEARKQGYDTMGDLISGEIENGLAGNSRRRRARPVTTAVRKRTVTYESRFAYVKEMLENVMYPPRQRGYYRDGHQDAIQRYLRRMNLNPKDMNMYENIVTEEIKKYYANNEHKRGNKYDEGYYEGLRFIQRTLRESKERLMEEVSDRLSAALHVY